MKKSLLLAVLLLSSAAHAEPMEFLDWFGWTGINFIGGLTAYAWIGMFIGDAIGNGNRDADGNLSPNGKKADVVFSVIWIILGIVLLGWWFVEHS
ncbi:hypothetical protein N9X66_09170 [Gammaproteobacteria bacterium]|nr:hypothetical protein [Gammaproteobacteria bacterium]